MFEILSVVGILLIAASVMERQRSGKGNDQKSDAERPAARIGARVETSAPNDAKGMTAVPRDARFAFVASFGVRPDELRELHVYAQAGEVGEFPKKITDLLWKLYDNGYAVGEELMAVLHHGRPLKEGEAIYVAVARNEKSNATRTIAFLDRVRAC